MEDYDAMRKHAPDCKCLMCSDDRIVADLQRVEDRWLIDPKHPDHEDITRWLDAIKAIIEEKKLLDKIAVAAEAYCSCSITTPIPGTPSITDRRHDLWKAVKEWRGKQ